jgi:uroporphyrinogen III methyltransferase/synthase
LIFTSTNAVAFFLERLDLSSTDIRSLRARICAIGPATRQAIETLHVKVDVTPDESAAEGVVAVFKPFDMNGKRALLPRASSARELVPDTLRKMGARVDVVDAYQNVIPTDAAVRAKEIFRRSRKPDWVTFTSSSTVKNLLALVDPGALSGVRVASIGPVTSKTAQMHALRIDAEAQDATIESLVEAICASSA